MYPVNRRKSTDSFMANPAIMAGGAKKSKAKIIKATPVLKNLPTYQGSFSVTKRK